MRGLSTAEVSEWAQTANIPRAKTTKDFFMTPDASMRSNHLSVVPAGLRVCQALRARRCRQQHRLLRHHDPGDGIGNQPNPRHKGCDQPDQPDDGHVDIKVFREAEADAGDLASLPGP